MPVELPFEYSERMSRIAETAAATFGVPLGAVLDEVRALEQRDEDLEDYLAGLSTGGGVSLARYALTGSSLASDATWAQVSIDSETFDTDGIGALSSNTVTVTPGSATRFRLTARVTFGVESEGSWVHPSSGDTGFAAGFSLDGYEPVFSDREEWHSSAGASTAITFGMDESYYDAPDSHPDTGWLDVADYSSPFTVAVWAYAEDVSYLDYTGETENWLCVELQ